MCIRDRVYDELEKEGFLVCRVGVGSFISTSNLDKLKDSKRRVLEEKVWDMLQQAKTLDVYKRQVIFVVFIVMAILEKYRVK